MNRLIRDMFHGAFAQLGLQVHTDAALLQAEGQRLAFTTDSYVVKPLFFPGGDIGSLAVCGTVNDLAMVGARPLWLSVGFILEEGLAMDDLWRIVRSMADAASQAGVQIVTGDTKVVDRGSGDQIFINTSGVGVVDDGIEIRPQSIRPGDAILVSGDLGRHGIAIMAAREGLEFQDPVASDAASLNGLVAELLTAGIELHCLRDLTRGGLTSALNEIAATTDLGIEIDEALIPVREDIRGACEILGFDPLYVACEGRLAAFVPPLQVEAALTVMRAHNEAAAAIGAVAADPPGVVQLRTMLGVPRVLDMLSGEQLPRIC